MTAVELTDVTKKFGNLVAVNGFSMSIEPGELVCLLGPSGCGKSTTMRIVGGFESPTEGRVSIHDEDVTEAPPYQRDCSMVFQSWALFPHKTVIENVEFGLKMDGVDKEKREKRARELLEVVQMSSLEDHRPTELSGGQRQRVALARSLAVNPHILLLDEPLSNLDRRLREEMQIELKELHDSFEQTMLYVTHDQNEAFTLADRIGIMNEGKLVQVGDPRSVYNNPTNDFVEKFLGDTNMVSATVSEVTDGSISVRSELEASWDISLPEADTPVEGSTVRLSLRPEFLSVGRSENAGSPEEISVTGTVSDPLYRGSTVRYFIDVEGTELFVEKSVKDDTEFSESDQVVVSWNPDEVIYFDEEGQRLQVNGMDRERLPAGE